MDSHQTRPARISKGADVMDYDSVIIVALYTFGALMEMITLWYLCKIVLGESKRSPRETLVVFGITGVLALVLSMMDVTSNQRMLGFYIILLIPTMMFEGHILLKLFVCVAFFCNRWRVRDTYQSLYSCYE